MIKSFRDADTERLWKEERPRRLPASLRKPALKKLQMLNAAGALGDLAVPPGNRLERLRGDREGQHRIASTTSTGSALSGGTETRTRLK